MIGVDRAGKIGGDGHGMLIYEQKYGGGRVEDKIIEEEVKELRNQTEGKIKCRHNEIVKDLEVVEVNREKQ